MTWRRTLFRGLYSEYEFLPATVIVLEGQTFPEEGIPLAVIADQVEESIIEGGPLADAMAEYDADVLVFVANVPNAFCCGAAGIGEGRVIAVSVEAVGAAAQDYRQVVWAHELGHLAGADHMHGSFTDFPGEAERRATIMVDGDDCEKATLPPGIAACIRLVNFQSAAKAVLQGEDGLQRVANLHESGAGAGSGGSGNCCGGGGVFLGAPSVNAEFLYGGYIGPWPAGAYSIYWSFISGATYYKVSVGNQTVISPAYSPEYIEVIFDVPGMWVDIYVQACDNQGCGFPGHTIVSPPGSGYPPLD